MDNVGEVSEDPQESYKGPEKNKFLKLLVMSFGIIFIGMLIISVVFMFGGFSSNNISQQGLIIGASLSLKENNSVKFKVGEDDHSLGVNSVGKDSVEVIIKSEPIYLTLRINEIREIDLNEDGKNDLRIKLVNIQDGKAIIAVKYIENEICAENWKCSDWSECIKGLQKRKCVDLNYCQTYAFRPIERQECLEVEYVEGGGQNQNKENQTNTNKITSKDKQNTTTNTTSNINITDSNQVNTTLNDFDDEVTSDEDDGSLDEPIRIPIFKFTCNKNIESFIAYSKTCGSFNILCNLTKEITEKAVVEEVLSYYELRGIKDEKCILYYEYTYLNVYPLPQLYSSASSTGINIVLTEINKDFEDLRGKKFICYYSPQKLIERINNLREGIIIDLSGERDIEYCSEITSTYNTMTSGTG